MQSNEFFLVSYLPLDDIQSIIDYKVKQIISYAFILHDKDVYSEKDCLNKDSGIIDTLKVGTQKPSHVHIYLKLCNSRNADEIKRWFVKKDINGKNINCLREIVRNRIGVINYLIHNTKGSKDKYQYNKDDIYSFNIEDIEEDTPKDITFDIVTDILNSVPKLVLLRKYGRDYLYHYSCYKDFVSDLRREEKEEVYNEYIKECYGD